MFLSLFFLAPLFAAIAPYLAGASAVAGIAGVAMSVQGQRAAARAANDTAKYNAKVQRNQSMQETEALKENARRKTRDNARMLGQQRAALAQSGLAMEGTPLAVLGETAMTLQRDILDMGYEAETRRRSLLSGANQSIYQGQQQSSALKMQSAATAISGITQVATGYGQAKGLFAPKTPKV